MSFKRGRIFFEVPLDDIVAVELVTFMGRKAVWMKWREGQATREVSVEGNVFKSADILRLHQLLQELLRPRGLSV